MKYNKFATSLMLSTVLLSSAGTVLADQVKTTSETNVSQSSTKESRASQDSSKESSKLETDESATEIKGNDAIQTLKEQKMVIKKVIAKGGSQMATVTSNTAESDKEKSLGISESSLKGVPNSKFVVYDVTNLMDSIIKEKLGIDDKQLEEANSGSNDATTSESTVEGKVSENSSTSESSSMKDKKDDPKEEYKQSSTTSTNNSKESSESKNTTDDQITEKVKNLRKGDSLRKEISERAAKLNKDQLKSIAEVTTGEDGVAEVKLPIDGKYHAYYVVNTETAKESYATNASPIVVITPVTDDAGVYASEFTIYPKSDEIPKETPEKSPENVETTATMYQTGHQKTSVFTALVNWVSSLFR